MAQPAATVRGILRVLDVPSAVIDRALQTRLRELLVVFLKLGTIGFGGPAAHIALMEHEVVRRRRWLTESQFLDLIGAVNLIPGPNSTELAIHVGRVRAGVAGLVVAGAAFILPAFVIVTAIAYSYERVGRLPETVAILYGIKPAMIAIVLQALLGLGRTAIKSRALAIAGCAALVAVLLRPMDEVAILVIVGFGAGVVAWLRARAGGARLRAIAVPFGAVMAAPAVQAAAAAPVTLGPLFLVFAKAGSLLFGSGYVLLAFLRADLVERLAWLTNAQLLDAIVVGQVTPGPVFTTATFIGYTLAGLPGAIVATAGIFLPAFVFVAVSAPLIPMMRRSRVTGAVLDGVNVASLALMTAVTLTLARAVLVDAGSIAIAALSAVLLLRFRVNATLVIAGSALIGLILV
jgi:chromate transporter